MGQAGAQELRWLLMSSRLRQPLLRVLPVVIRTARAMAWAHLWGRMWSLRHHLRESRAAPAHALSSRPPHPRLGLRASFPLRLPYLERVEAPVIAAAGPGPPSAPCVPATTSPHHPPR